MDWSEIAHFFPEKPGAERERVILDLVRQGCFVHRWAPLPLTVNGRLVELAVSEDALMLGDVTNAVRVNVNATTAQLIADELGALLLTPLVADRIRAAAAIALPPAPQFPDARMAWTHRMVEHSRAVDALKAGRQGLSASVGKDWVLTNRLQGRPDRAANYGWHVKRSQFFAVTAGLFVLQPLGLAHDRFHVDYSQVWRGMCNVCRVDGKPRDLVAVLGDPVLGPGLCHEGVLKVLRLPALSSDAAVREPQSGTRTASLPRGTPTPPLIPFVQARNFGKGRTATIDTIVIHSMEAVEKPDTAERVASWFGGPNAPMASAHYCVDADSVVQCVREADTAFHAPGVNQRSIGIEHAGYAKQSAEDWADPYSDAMLLRSAELVGELCRRYEIPVRWLDEAALKSGEAGITTHAAVSRAFRKSSHTDPGANFPFDRYLAMVECAR